jgi:enterochelin esterase-like enzyme
VSGQDADEIIGPDYAPAPEWRVRDDVPRGRVLAFTLRSQDSVFYPGIRRIDNAITRQRDAYGNRQAAEAHEQSAPCPYVRSVWVYVPVGVAAEAPFMVVQDGYGFLGRVPRLLDNMIADGALPPLVAVLVDHGGGDAQGSQRGLEYDTLSGVYGDFIEREVLPRVEQECGITLSRDPDKRATMGASSGAACAFTMAWEHPERWGKVLSYSGTFVNQQSPPDPRSPRGAWEYHASLVPAAPKKPIRIWMQVGEKDLHHEDPEETWHNWPLANDRMAAVLTAKGYDTRYVFCNGAVHVDARAIEATLPGALKWLWR